MDSHWDYCVGEGWKPIVKKAVVQLKSIGYDSEISQIKEKFGGLRIYLNTYCPEAERIIMQAERMAANTCEQCGSHTGVSTSGPGWIKTLCCVCRGVGDE